MQDVEHICEECRYCAKGIEIDHCHKHPPSPQFPEVVGTDWCGGWRPKKARQAVFNPPAQDAKGQEWGKVMREAWRLGWKTVGIRMCEEPWEDMAEHIQKASVNAALLFRDQCIASLSSMKVQLNNAQGVPFLSLLDRGEELLRVDFCKDGGLIWLKGMRTLIGTRIGCRPKRGTASFEDADASDDIEIGSLADIDRMSCEEKQASERAESFLAEQGE